MNLGGVQISDGQNPMVSKKYDVNLFPLDGASELQDSRSSVFPNLLKYKENLGPFNAPKSSSSFDIDLSRISAIL